jgi:hypothetical protein
MVEDAAGKIAGRNNRAGEEMSDEKEIGEYREFEKAWKERHPGSTIWTYSFDEAGWAWEERGRRDREKIEQRIKIQREACSLYRNASIQDHTAHLDKTGQNGMECPECIRARRLRERADRLMEEGEGLT